MNQIATTIFNQIGGNSFMAMVGGKNISFSETSLQFKIGRNKTQANYVTIQLENNDLYTMQFVSIRGTKFKIVADKLDLFAEQLNEVFEAVTGLVTKMPTVMDIEDNMKGL